VMRKWLPTFGTSFGCAIALLLVVAAADLAAQPVMNGKPVRAYAGHVVMLNEREGRIVIAIDDGSKGDWRIGGYTVVLRGAERLPLNAVLASPRVTAWVSPDGTVQRITLGAARPAPTGGRTNGQVVRSYLGRVEMMNLRDGRIVIDVDDGSKGDWRIGGYTVVLRGAEREPLKAALDSRRVRVWVTREGQVERINILAVR